VKRVEQTVSDKLPAEVVAELNRKLTAEITRVVDFTEAQTVVIEKLTAENRILRRRVESLEDELTQRR
jgi:cell division protein FtsB